MDDAALPITEHLAELRTRLAWIIGALAVGTALSFNQAERIFGFLVEPVIAALPEGDVEISFNRSLYAVMTEKGAILTRFPIWQRVWAIMNRPMVLLSGVILLYDNLPSAFQAILWYNPLIHVMGVSRAGFYPYYAADYVSLTYVFGVAMGCFVVGFLLLRRYGRWILQTF